MIRGRPLRPCKLILTVASAAKVRLNVNLSEISVRLYSRGECIDLRRFARDRTDEVLFEDGAYCLPFFLGTEETRLLAAHIW